MLLARLAHTPTGALSGEGASEATLAALESGSSGSRFTMLRRVLSELNREVPPEQWSRAVLPLIVQSLNADTGAIFRVTPDNEAQVVSAYGATRKRGFPYAVLDLRDTSLQPLTQRPSVVEMDAEERPVMQRALRAVCHPRAEVVCLASAFMGHSLAGLVVLSRRTPRWSEDELPCVAAVADAVGLALGTAALSRQSNESEIMLEIACTVAQAISGSLDLSRTYRQIAYSAAHVVGDCNCLLLELDVQDRELVAVACSDPADQALLGLRVCFDDARGSAETLRHDQSIVVEDVVWSASIDQACRERLGIRSALFVPMYSEDGLIGSLLLYSTARRDRYTESDITRARTVAQQAASAICNARLYRNLERSERRARTLVERITRLRESQRLSFANMLHDDVLQDIVATLYQVEALRAAAEYSPDGLDRVAAMLKETISEARNVVRDLRPPAVEGLGLDGALKALAERASSNQGPPVTARIAEPELLSLIPPSVNTALYVIAREAVRNTRKHARAHECTLELEVMDEAGLDKRHVRLIVSDDGSGFDPNAVTPGDHFGLTMMEEQTALVGGTIRVQSRTGQGTTVEVLVPLRSSTLACRFGESQ